MNGLVGQQIDNFKVTAFIARGGMAEVYLAEDVNLQRPIALKVMLSDLALDETAVARFQREARTVAKLDHPNIIQIYTTGSTANNQPYLAMQYVEGGSLQDKLAALARQGQQMSLNESLTLVYDMARALQVAHNAGIVHRDLKPSNILLQPDGRPILTDLGIAAVKSNATRLTQTGNVLGTPHYMAPEQARGETVDGRTDIYALGIILFELLSGHVPFDADSPLSVLHQHIYQELPPLRQFRPDLSATTYQTVATCLQKDAHQRFQSAEDLALALEHAMVSEGVRTPHVLSPYPVPEPTMVLPPPTPTRSNKLFYALGGILLVIILGSIGWWIWSKPPVPDPLESPIQISDMNEPTAVPTQPLIPTTTTIEETAVLPTPKSTEITPGIVIADNNLYADGTIILAGNEFPDCTLQDPNFAPGDRQFVVPIPCNNGNNAAAIFRADGSEKQIVTSDWDSIYADYYTWTDDGRYLVYLRQNDCCGQVPPASAPAPGVVWVDVDNGRKEMHTSPAPLFEYRVVQVVNDDTLNLRSGPGFSNPVLVEIPPNATNVAITGLGVNQGSDWWVPVSYNNNSGWVNSYYLAPEIQDPTIIALLNTTDEAIDSTAITAKRLYNPPTIDGNLNEWGGTISYKSNHTVHTDVGWDGSDDLEAIWQLGWDLENLYVAVQVTDDLHVQAQSDESVHEGDSLEIQFDTNREGDYGTNINSDDFQINISPGNFGNIIPNAFLWHASSSGRYGLVGGRNTTVRAIPRSPGGYFLEAAIPWSDLGISPTPGLTIGIALNADDNDRPGEAVQEVMKSSAPNRAFLSPETWGTLHLSE